MHIRAQAKSRGFTLVEALIAVALGSVVIGAGMYVYIQGNKGFTTTTEHTTFREEAMLCLANVTRDVEQIMVSPKMWPDNSNYLVVEPFKLTNPYTQQIKDPRTGELLPYSQAGTGVKFYRYHHTEMAPDPARPGKKVPRLIGRLIEYEVKPINPAKPADGVMLLRNGQRVNSHPLSEVIFQKVPQETALDQVQASPNAVLKVTVIPKGGIWKQMRADTIETLKKDGTVLTQIHHLAGCESQYTSLLFLALQKIKGAGGSEGALTGEPLLQAVYNYAKTVGNGPIEMIQNSVNNGPVQSYVPPTDLVKMEETPFHEFDNGGPSSNSDPYFAKSEELKGDQQLGGGLGQVPWSGGGAALTEGGGSTEGAGGHPDHCPAVQNH